MRQFSLLVKPTSADCNLRCEYCFYLGRSALYPDSRRHRMSDAVLEAMVGKYMATDQLQYSFAWQGGEPTLMGVEFFRKVVALQEKHGRRGGVVSNGLQTNATLIDDELAAHLAKYRFLIGVSIDGPKQIHDHYRHKADGSGSHKDVLLGIDCLKRHRVEFNALVLVNSENVTRGKEVYQYLKDLGIYHHQYIPCVEFAADGSLQPFAIDGERWGRFLCDIFDSWIDHDVRSVSIRQFDSILGFILDRTYSVCTMMGACNSYLVVEHNGDVYPCDFYVEQARRLGNIVVDSYESVLTSPIYADFSAMKADWNEACSSCDYLDYCSGDCLKHRITPTSGHRALSVLCSGWKTFYAHALPELRRLALSIAKSRSATTGRPMPASGGRVAALPNPGDGLGRNDPCFCQSGRKFKRCHGAR